MKKVVIMVYRGNVEVISAPDDIEVVLHDYDINDIIEEGNPDREYGKDELGDYEVIGL